jgi:hypothetical protein
MLSRYPGAKRPKHARLARPPARQISGVALSEKGYELSMYIGLGTVILIIVIILVIAFLRRA